MLLYIVLPPEHTAPKLAGLGSRARLNLFHDAGCAAMLAFQLLRCFKCHHSLRVQALYCASRLCTDLHSMPEAAGTAVHQIPQESGKRANVYRCSTCPSIVYFRKSPAAEVSLSVLPPCAGPGSTSIVCNKYLLGGIYSLECMLVMLRRVHAAVVVFSTSSL